MSGNITGSPDNGYNDSVFAQVLEGKDEVPDTFYVYMLDRDTSNSQRIVVWRYEDGHLTLVKTFANPTITNGNSCYDLAGAEYTLYEDSDHSKVAKDADGNDAVLTTKFDGT